MVIGVGGGLDGSRYVAVKTDENLRAVHLGRVEAKFVNRCRKKRNDGPNVCAR